jgi:hypothetical protein
MNVCNKLEYFFLASLSNLVLCVGLRQGAYPRVKSLPMTNTLTYFLAKSEMNKKSLITLKPGPNVVKLFKSIIYVCFL